MRDILFRGKRTHDNEWIVGSLHADKFTDDEEYLCCEINQCDVYPETIGQYTGLTDKNGKKIFEGDVVKAVINRYVYDRTDIREEKGLIGYDNMGMLSIITSFHNDAPIYSDIFCELTLSSCVENFWFEIIGNIHDNPELLKGEE